MTLSLVQRLVRGCGYDLTPRRKAKLLESQLVAVLQHFEIDCVIDVGANVGQYARQLREWGYRGRIVSFEPLAQAHAALSRAARDDAEWTVASLMAIGAQDGEAQIEVSAESDMSSLLAQNETLRRISPSSAVAARVTVPVHRLDTIAHDYVSESERIFLKVDTQGYEAQVLAGAPRLLRRLLGVQLEMALVPCYEGERDYRELLDTMDAQGFAPYLFIPGYFERKLARQLQIDGVFIRS